MSVKIYDNAKEKWVTFPGTVGAPGKDAYLIAQENGYTGTKEEYTQVLTKFPEIINSIETVPTKNSNNLITSGGVWQAIENIKQNISDLSTFRIKIVSELPITGEKNIIYLLKTDSLNTYTGYLFVDNQWETVGNIDIDLSNYYNKSEIDNKFSEIDSNRVISENEFTTSNRILVSENLGRKIKDSGISLSNVALTSTLGNLAKKNKVEESDLNFKLQNISIDTELNELSENPVQNKVITSKLNTINKENTWRPINVNGNVLNDNTTELSIINGNNINTELLNGVLTISNTSDIPFALPNPFPLTINGNSYTGSSKLSVNLINKPQPTNIPGNPGIFIGSAGTYAIDTIKVNDYNPIAIIVVPTSTVVTFGSVYKKMKGLDDLVGGKYKCYYITYINSSITLVNGIIYE